MAEANFSRRASKAPMRKPATINPPPYYPDRAAWFDATKAPVDNAGENLLYFWRGIGARNEEIIALEKAIITQFTEEGIFEVDDITDSETLTKMSLIINNLLIKLPHLIISWPQAPIPVPWLEDWVMALLLEIWWKRQKSAKDGSAYFGVALLPPGTHIDDISPAETSIRAPPASLRGLVIFRLLVMSEDSRTEIATEEMHAYRALPPDSNKMIDTHYKFDILRREFENVLNSTDAFKDNKINLRHGKFGYEVRKRFKEIKRQQDFENAVTYLFKGFKKDGALEFTFYMENKSEKAIRESRQKASTRVRSQNTAKPSPGPQFFSVVENPLPTRKVTSDEKTLQDLERPRSTEPRKSKESNRVASPSQGVHRKSSSASKASSARARQSDLIDQVTTLPLSPQTGRSETVEQVIEAPTPASAFSLSPTSPKKPSPIKRFGNYLKRGKGKAKAQSAIPTPLKASPKKADPGSATSSIKRGANNRPRRPSSTAKPAPAPPAAAAVVSTPVAPRRASQPARARNRLSGMFKRPFTPIPESPKSVIQEKVEEEKTEEVKAAQRDEKFNTLGKELERETFVKGKSEEDVAVDDILAAYRRTDGDNDDEEFLDEVEEEEEEAGDGSPEFKAGQLQKIANSPELTQLQDPDLFNESYPRWLECCSMFKIDPDDHSNTGLIRIAGLKSRLYPYQAFGTWWQMRKSREVGGGFVGDEMGLGKTLSFLAYMVVERQLAWLWNQIHLSRTKLIDDGKHHKTENDPRPCPSEGERPYWISCPCSTSNVTSQMKPKPGVRVALVPQPLVFTWMAEWDKHIDTSEKRLEMKLAVAHPPAFELGGGAASVILDARTPTSRDRMKAGRVFSDIKKKCAHDEPLLGQERILLLTTAQGFKSAIKHYEYETEIQITKDKKSTTKKVKNAGIVFGIAMVDEIHEARPKKGEKKDGIIAEVPITNSPFLWGYSGTPITNSPRGLEQLLFALEDRSPKLRLQSGALQSSWQEDHDLQKYTYQNFDEVCKEYESWISSNTETNLGEEFKERFAPFLTKFLLRRTAESSWFGRPLIKLKVHYHHDVVLKHSPGYDKEILDFKRKFVDEDIKKAVAKLNEGDAEGSKTLSFPAQYTLASKLRLFASFPYLVKFALAPKGPDHLEFDREETRIRGASSQIQRSLYSLHLRHICESSPKIAWLYNFLKEFFAKAEESCDGDGTRERKLIIMSSFDPVLIILKLFLTRYFSLPPTNLATILSSTPTREATLLIKSFSELNATTHEPLPTARQRSKASTSPSTNPLPIRILIGNTAKLGKGLNLTRASTLVLFEPDIVFQREAQIYSRIHRIGQHASEGSNSYRLWCETATAAARDRSAGWQGEEWEWESRVVDRVRKRGLAFGRKMQDVDALGAFDFGYDGDGEGSVVDFEAMSEVVWVGDVRRGDLKRERDGGEDGGLGNCEEVIRGVIEVRREESEVGRV
ncbi:P-loop containing nucleoside triphosphate hydrolase [Glarea lozoyensis ATCC 20868]|uniref:p-loop containing nucleoside triphosphate hydrolase n=1 Tax=Glarea lozoyensis (strain ATCC 20868 / MF5171) TaxID=1116229 RepID=S3D890_GLAL2|nr:P-loop containing nucleoside triphosphate hydrolase [Glarea lozoyensis ATCC 20868]EPE33324.1 P-loop containing nucleoside triphosphate hydrolase [Glarea lozoyensis ATCC 20868]